MKKYIVYFLTSLKMITAYKVDFLLQFIFDIVFFLIFVSLWLTIYRNGDGDISGYSLSNTITYYFITALIYKLGLDNSIYLGWQIWSGYFTNDLLKPWSISLINFLDTLAEKFLTLVLMLPVMVLMYFVAKDHILFPTLNYWLYFLITLALGFLINYFLILSINALTFRFGDQEPNVGLVSFISSFLAGSFFPLAFLSGPLKDIFFALPFKFLFFVPAETFLQKIPAGDFPMIWLQEIGWVILFYILYKIIYKNGVKYYTGTGR